MKVSLDQLRGAILVMLFAIVPAWAQQRAQQRDPLNPAEVDEMREVTQEPEKRLKLILKFARARLDAIDQARADTKTSAADKTTQVHDLLQDFVTIYDELGDNLDMYRDQSADLRRPLKDVIQGDAEFRARLRKLKESSTPDESKEDEFVLTSAIDSVNDGSLEHRKLLEEENAAPRKKK